MHRKAEGRPSTGRTRALRQRGEARFQAPRARRDPKETAYVHYAATKAATDALTVGLSKELGPDRIRVNAVAPGIIETDMHAAMGDPDRPPARAAAGIPLGRAGQPEEVAGAIAWLLSPDASYTTRAVLRVSGGR